MNIFTFTRSRILSTGLVALVLVCLVIGCESSNTEVKLHVFLLGSESKQEEKAIYAEKLASGISSALDIEDLNSLDIILLDSRFVESKVSVQFSPLDAKDDRIGNVVDNLKKQLSKAVTKLNPDDTQLREYIKTIVSKTTTEPSAIYAIVGRLPLCHNEAKGAVKQIAQLNAADDAKPKLLWIIPGSRKTDVQLRNAFESKYEVVRETFVVPNYTDCDAGSGAQAPAAAVSTAPAVESFVISFARSATEAREIATTLAVADTSSRLYIYRDGDTSPLQVVISDPAKRVDLISAALFNGTQPQFNSVNYLLKSALYRWPLKSYSNRQARIVIAGSMPFQQASQGEKGILTSGKDLQRLPKDMEVVFVEPTNPGQLNPILRSAYSKLGYKTRVSRYVQ